MTLPLVGQLLSSPSNMKFGNAPRSHPPVTNNNAQFEAKYSNARWVGNKLTITAEGLMNCWYVPQAAPGKVSYCVVPMQGRDDAYVISDNFGGCEWHILKNSAFKVWAFIHVHRGDGATATYDMAPNWELHDVRRSANISKAGMYQGKLVRGGAVGTTGDGSTWAFSSITRTASNMSVESAILNVMPQENFRVRLANSGSAPYAPPRR